ncbi:MAG: hypothetical protein SCARUB_02418 [Candidatus Scalindua rubra]|uniref:Uncharacterized protein n=1 Tax=Candidatus Scalindua rubra TaxID=1872076 RepID=A0A1E3XBZ2_9BACT|nr:MAG: hypothetical protein SCARUB_02418 [Candidatus Scalindua rubra]
MSDGIQPIRFVPQINKVNPKGKSGDKKGDKGGEQQFSDYLSDKDKGIESKSHKERKDEPESGEYRKKEDENTLRTKEDHDLDDTCGTVIDTEV